MEALLTFALLGLGSGALIAGIAVGVVISWRGSGTINIAAGATVMVAGYLFWALRSGFFGVSLGAVPAIVLTLLAMALFATAVEFAAVRPLRTASPLAKLVASIGVLLLAQAVVQLVFGTSPLDSPSVLPDTVLTIGGVTAPVAQVILAGVAIALAVGLAALYRYTGFGLATRAAAENETSAALAGLAPHTISLVNAILANLVAGLVGILAASIVGINATTLPLLIVPALAAALFARFTSFLICCAVGLAIGVAESLLLYASSQSWYPTQNGLALPGVQQLLEFALIVVALYLRGSSLPQRGEVAERSLPAVPRQDHLLRRVVVLPLICAVALVVLPSEFRQAVTTGLVSTVLCLSFVVIMGYVGQLSVVQLALAGVASFAVSRFSTAFGLGFPLGALLSVVAATLIGLLIGAAALRVRGVTLVVVTLAAASAIQQFVFANDSWGGGQTGAPVSEPTLFGIDLGTKAAFRGLDGSLPSPVFGFVVLVITVLAYLLVANLRRSDLGQQMLAVRSNERAAAAAGVDVRSVKTQAVAIASALAGVAGALFAYNYGTVSAGSYDTSLALALVASVYVLGVTMAQGAVLAGFGATGAVIPLVFQKWVFPEDRVALYVQLIIGASLIVQLNFFPDGLLVSSAAKRLRRAAQKSEEALRSAAVPVAAGERRPR
jgi:branched-subunit amino acid ABC-type transport system permease component